MSTFETHNIIHPSDQSSEDESLNTHMTQLFDIAFNDNEYQDNHNSYITSNSKEIELIKHKYFKSISVYSTFNIESPNNLNEIQPIKTNFLKFSTNNPYSANMEQFNHDIWTYGDDFVGNHNDDEDINMLVQTQITSLFEETLYIINESVIQEDEYDDNFKSFLKCASDGVQVLMTTMFETAWIFNPIEKFMWIYLMLSSKYEPRAMKYLVNSPYFNAIYMTKKDKLGFSPLFHLLLNDNIDLDLIHNFLTIENLSEIYFNNNLLICYTIIKTKTFNYIINKLDISTIDYTTYPNPLILSLIYNENVTNIIIENDNVLSSIINKKDQYGITCLIHSLVNQPTKFKMLIESKYCTQGLIDATCENYGNMLMVAIKFQPSIVNYILDSHFMSQNLLFGVTNYQHGISKNILLETVDDIDLFKKIITHKYFNKDLLFFMHPSSNLLNELMINHNDAFKLLLEADLISDDLLTHMDSSNISPILTTAIFHCDLLKLLIKKGKFKKEYLSIEFINTKKNILMILLEHLNVFPSQLTDSTSDDIKSKLDVKYYCINELYDLGYIDNEILSLCDNDNINTFWYICKYYHDLAIKLINNNENMQIYLENEIIRSIIYHGAIDDNYYVINELINKNLITIETINTVDNYGNNILMEACIYNPFLVHRLIHNKLFNKETLSTLNIAKNNCLTLLLKYGIDVKINNTISLKILDCLLESEYMNSDILNNKNIYGEFSFLLACQQGISYIKKIMNSKYFNIETFSTNTFNGSNCFVFACKSNDYELLKMICEHELFTENMFTAYDLSNIPYIFYGMLSNDQIAKYILDHKYCTNKLLNDSYKLLLLKNNVSCKIIETILNSKNCSSETLLNTDSNGNNCLSLFINENNISVVKKILSSPYCTNKLLLHQNHNGFIFFESLFLSEKMLDIILNSPIFDPNILLLKDNNGSNILNYFLAHNKYNLVRKIILSEKCPIAALNYESPNTKSSIIVNMFNYNDDIANAVLNMKTITKEDINQVNKNGNTCLHMYAKKLWNDMQIHKLETSNNEFVTKKLNNFNKYINSDKFSEKLFETLNDNGDTFLLLNPHLISIVLKSKYCTPKLLKTINNNTNIFLQLYINNQYYLEDFLKCKYFDKSFLTEKIESNSLNMISRICMNDQDNILDIIMELPICTNDIINYVDNSNFNVLMYAIMGGNTLNITKLINSKFDLTESFLHIDNNNRNILMLSSLVSSEILSLIINCKYITAEMFFCCDNYKHNALIYALNKNVETVQLIIESVHWCDELMYYTDIDNDFIMLYPYDKPSIIKYLLESNKCNKNIIALTNNFGRNCSHYYAKYNDMSLSYLLESEKCCDQIINHQDNVGETCLHVACQYNIKSVDRLINSKYMIEKLILQQNLKGHNAIMTILIYNPTNAIDLYKNFIASKNLIYQIDKKGNNLMFYAIKYNLKLLRILLKSQHCDKQLLNIRNNNNMTCYMYASKHNGEALKFLLKHKDTDNEMLYSNHIDYGSALTIGAKYQAEAIKHLLSWKCISWKVINSLIDDNNFLSIACMYNSQAVKYAIESEVDLTVLFDKKYNNNPFLNACRYQPEAVKYILDSKYGSRQMILTKIDNRTYLDEAYDLQPKGMVYILKSKYGDIDLLNVEDERGYKLISRIKSVYNVNTIDDISKISLTYHDNELATSKYKACNICLTFKQSVLFSPCHHMCCIGCSFKMKKCHQCRAIIEDRIVIDI